jgi:hypothetical protein
MALQRSAMRRIIKKVVTVVTTTTWTISWEPDIQPEDQSDSDLIDSPKPQQSISILADTSLFSSAPDEEKAGDTSSDERGSDSDAGKS